MMLFDRLSGRQRDVLACIFIVCVGLLIYSHTLKAPFYFDDIVHIVESSPSRRDLAMALHNIFNSRGIADLTFALNYSYGGLDVTGYHVVNIFIHLASSVVVYSIMTLLVQGTGWVPFAGALIFLTHPLQTQSVTYIIQRYTSLSGLFLLLCTMFFCRAYQRFSGDRRYSALFCGCYVSALCCGAAAVFTKQNAAVIPVLLMLVVCFFIEQHGRYVRVVALVAPFAVAPLCQVYTQLINPVFMQKSSIATVTMVADGTVAAATPLTYLVTEFSVIWLYIRLLFLPYGQALVYDYPLVANLFTTSNVVAFIGILVLLGAAFVFRNKNKMISCGILWFFVGLAVESTIIPLDPVFEHRLYVPLFGFVLVTLGLVRLIPSAKIGFIVFLFLVGSYGVLTWQRNALWSDPVAFYEDNLKRAPGKEWIYVDLGKLYIERQKFDRAETLLRRALELSPTDYKAYNNLGTLYDLTGRPENALSAYRQAITIDPLFAEAYTNLGAVYAGQKRWKDAISQYSIAISIKPDFAMAYYNLGVARYSTDDLPGACAAFRMAAELAPTNLDILYNWGIASAETGNVPTALGIVPRIINIDPVRGKQLAAEIRLIQHVPD